MSRINKQHKDFKITAEKPALDIDYPIFCFKYLSEKSIKDCQKPKFYFDFMMRLKKLSELRWKGIQSSQKHSFGLESLPKKNIKVDLPLCVTEEVQKLDVFRATGDNHSFIGIRKSPVFHILFIETNFGDIYDHN